MDDIIKKYFYNINTGFVSSGKLYKKLKEDGHDIKLKDVSMKIRKSSRKQSENL